MSGRGSRPHVVRDLLSITAVHPMREDAVEALPARAGGDWPTVHALIAAGQLVETTYGGHRFYLRRLRGAIVAQVAAESMVSSFASCATGTTTLVPQHDPGQEQSR